MNTISAVASNKPDDFTPALSWKEICELGASGQFDGFHVDTDEWGRILMTPVTFVHGALSYRIARLIDDLTDRGVVVCKVGVRTRKGVKAPDVMWTSATCVRKRTSEYDDEQAGEICVEILSPSNHPREIEEKRRLYFEQGAIEVWICNTSGQMRFWVGPDEERASSRRVSEFPKLVSID